MATTKKASITKVKKSYALSRSEIEDGIKNIADDLGELFRDFDDTSISEIKERLEALENDVNDLADDVHKKLGT